ncbi:MAG: exodeoxyribonuclease VII large subunit [Synergistaceae bacterium]|nr:exodeoxyribonuclease VII large subunit [Synergistota bacterium]NLM71202.1 exodeoxyribonuclease VII large subunit [Synergistaceae bacterium]
MAKTIPVDELTSRISSFFLKDPLMKSVGVLGEVSELKKHTSGHVYFTLLGVESRISCAMFRSFAIHIPKWPINGDEVIAEGSVSVYAPRGAYQLLVRRMVPVGKGAAERARLELMARLEAEGLFSPELKRPLPPYPEKVAVVTSATGAALRDVLAVASKRMPSCEIVLIPAVVQGYEAPESIVAALARTGLVRDLDCVLLVRGGGARDDLAPFDDERVVRAVGASAVPLVTGVGHEIDETLSDLAADHSSPTPSAAAELVFPDSRSLLRLLSHRSDSARSALELAFSRSQRSVDSLFSRASRAFAGYAADSESALRLYGTRLGASMERSLAESGNRLGECAASLDGLSPLKALGRGFIMCEKEGAPVLSAAELRERDELRLRFRDGEAEAEILSSTLSGSALPGDPADGEI